MTKKLTMTIAVSVLAAWLVAPLTFASEVTGHLSSGPVSSQTQTGGQNTSGTITGSVSGGTNSGGGSGNGNGGGGGGTVVLSSGGSVEGSSVSTTGDSENSTISGNALAALPIGAEGGVGTVAGASTNTNEEASDQVAQADLTDAGQAAIPLAAAAGDATPLSTKLSWTLFIIAVLALGGYGIYRRYGMVSNKGSTDIH